MALDAVREKELREIAKQMRIEIITMLHNVKTGHPGGSLSAVEILTVLYHNQMNINCREPGCSDRDRFVASKGHCAPVLYTALADKGYFSKDELKKLRQLNCMLQGHPDMKKTPGVDISTGSLGLGLSVGIGMCLAAKLNGQNFYSYVLLGDGELQEGQIWEAAMSAVKFKLDHLIAIVDNNGVQLDGTVEEIMPLGDIGRKFAAFGWNVLTVDGHDIRALDAAIDLAKATKGLPTVIVAHTVKGKGVSFMEGKSSWHGKPIEDKDFAIAMAELGGVKQ
jgi:transketolase